MRQNTQFPATIVRQTKDGLKTKARLIRLSDGREEWLPASQTLGCTPYELGPPNSPSHWFTVTNWIAAKKGISDARAVEEYLSR